jgi:putative toxin-antitoxin system antitoxin component (TIGR02293 family)
MPTGLHAPDPATPDLAAFQRSLRRGGPGAHAWALLLGLRHFDTAELLARLADGLAYSALEHFQRNVELPLHRVAEMVQVPPRTLARRKEQGRLRPDESDRLIRASRVFARALELFEGDAEAARDWLGSAQPALGGAAPFDLVKSELGAREVEAVIGRLEHGAFS